MELKKKSAFSSRLQTYVNIFLVFKVSFLYLKNFFLKFESKITDIFWLLVCSVASLEPGARPGADRQGDPSPSSLTMIAGEGRVMGLVLRVLTVDLSPGSDSSSWVPPTPEGPLAPGIGSVWPWPLWASWERSSAPSR